MIFVECGQPYYVKDTHFTHDWWENWVNPINKVSTFPERLKQDRKDWWDL